MGHHISAESLLCAFAYLAPLLAIAVNLLVCEVREEREDREAE